MKDKLIYLIKQAEKMERERLRKRLCLTDSPEWCKGEWVEHGHGCMNCIKILEVSYGETEQPKL